jgi:hypothetical protein
MRAFWQVWLMPILMGVLSVFGLLSALLGTGIWHWLSWAALGMPLAIIAHYGWLKPKRAR